MFDIKRFFYFTLLLLVFIGFPNSNSYCANVVGDYSISGTDETSPLITGVKETFNRDVLISVKGAKINALKGAEITPYYGNQDYGNQDNLLLRIDKGKILFRIFPEVDVFTLTTPHAVMKTSRIVNASVSSVEGMIEVEENKRTIVRLSSGELELVTSEGKRKVREDEVVTIARVENKNDGQGNHYTPDDDDEDDDDGGAWINDTSYLPPVIVTTAVVGGATTGAIILDTDDDSDGVGDNPASRVEP